MAEVSNLQRHEEYLQENEFCFHTNNFDDFDPLWWGSDFPNPFFLDDCTASFDYVEQPENPELENEDDGDRMNTAVDLLESRETLSMEDPIWEIDSGVVEDSSLDFGLESGLGFESPALGVDLDSDSEEFEVNSGITSDGADNFVDDSFDDNLFQIGEEFEWEEVNERMHSEERETLNFAIDQIDEISVSSDVMYEGVNPNFGEDNQGNIEWEVLLAMNDLERNFELENSVENSRREVVLYLSEDSALSMEHDALFGHLVVNENASHGSPPAANSAVDNLPVVILTKEELGVVCAVCKDDIAIGEEATRMPCCHLFHGDCIVPWLRIRNTCPVCRYELPTDDADYERRRGRRTSNENIEG